MAINSLQEKFLHELGDMYDAEHRFLEGQQLMLKNASDSQLKSMITTHIEQSKQQVANLEQVFQVLGESPKRQTCDASKGIVTEAEKSMKEAGTDAIRDCLIGGSAAKVEHYEIANYRGLIEGAKLMNQPQILQLLQQNLQQEEQTAQLIEQSTPTLLQKAMTQEQAVGR